MAMGGTDTPMDRRAALQRQLECFSPWDDAERAHRDRMLALLDGKADPFARTHFAPGHFTASAFVVCPDRARLLLIWHTKLNRWLQPGGHIDPGDADVTAAARRELAEEAGLERVRLLGDGLFDLDIHRIPANPRRGEPAHDHLDLRLLFQAEHDRITAGSDAGDARWVALEQVTAAQTDASVMRAVCRMTGLGATQD